MWLDLWQVFAGHKCVSLEGYKSAHIHTWYIITTPLSRAPARLNVLSLIVDATLSHIRSVLCDAAEFILCQAC